MSDSCLKRIQERRSIRRYSNEPLPDADIEEILMAGFSAPSAGNRQPWRVILVKRQEMKEQLAAAAGGQTFLAQAPIVLVVCAVPQESAERYGERGRELYAIQDTAALVENLLLAAHLLGYSTCWIGAFNEELVVSALSIPMAMRPVAIIPVGRAMGKIPLKPVRRAMKEVVIHESF